METVGIAEPAVQKRVAEVVLSGSGMLQV
jgi:hypothetical protein